MSEKPIVIKLTVADAFSQPLSKYNQAVATAERNSKQLGSATKTVTDGYDQLSKTLNTAVLGFSAMKLIDIALDMRRLGEEVNIANQVFTALAGGTAEANAMLAAMQQRTGGVVDNMTLMAGASRLMQMGLADSKEEVAGLTEMAIKLGSALGMETNKAMEDFSLLLANQSYLRLDQFGISAGAVRARVAELKEEFPEMAKEARFAQAVLEKGQAALENLGDAADAGSTAVRRFETDVQNSMQNVASNIATGVEGLIGLAEVSLGTHPFQQAGQQAAEAWVASFGDNFKLYMSRTPLGIEESMDEILQRIADARVALGDDASIGQLVDKVAGDLWLTPEQEDRILKVAEFVIEEKRIADELAANRRDELNRLMAYADNQQSYYDQLERTRQSELNRFQAFNTNYIAEMDRLRMQQQGVGATSGLTGSAQTAFNVAGMGDMPIYEGLQDFQVAAEMPDWMRPEAAAEITKAYQDAVIEFETLKRLNEEGIITDDELDRAEQMKDNVGLLADEAQRAADNFANMKLSDVFGQAGGGMLGQMTDDIIARMKEEGASPEEIEAFQRSADLQSGRQTAASVAYEDQLLPIIEEIREKFGDDAAIKGMENATAFLEQARLLNLDPTTVANAIPGSTGFLVGSGGMGGGQQFTVQPGQTLSELSYLLGRPVDELLGATGAVSPNQVMPGTYTLGGSFDVQKPADFAAYDPLMYANAMLTGNGNWGTGGQNEAPSPEDGINKLVEAAQPFVDQTTLADENMQAIADKTTTIVDEFDTLTSKKHNLTLTVTLDDKTGGLLAQLSKGLTIMPSSGGSVRDAGGVVPGQVSSSSPAGARPNR